MDDKDDDTIIDTAHKSMDQHDNIHTHKRPNDIPIPLCGCSFAGGCRQCRKHKRNQQNIRNRSHNYINATSLRDDNYLEKDTPTIEATLFSHARGNQPMAVDALIDSGSPINIIDTTLFHSLCLPYAVKKVTNSYASASNHQLAIRGESSMKIKLPGRKWTLLRVFLCDNLTQKVILGTAGLNSLGFQLTLKTCDGKTEQTRKCNKHTHHTSFVPHEGHLKAVHHIFEFERGRCICTPVCEINKEQDITLDTCDDAFLDVITQEDIDLHNFNDEVLPKDISPDIQQLLQKYRDVCPKALPPEPAKVEAFKIYLTEDAKSFHIKSYRISHAAKLGVEKELAMLLNTGIIIPYDGDFLSPCIPVAKKDGSIRLVIDYRRLNTQTKDRPFHIPMFEEFLSKIGNAKHFSTLDLRSGYWQVPVEDDTIQYLGFSTHCGNYTWTRQPQGVKTACGHFQKVINKVLRGLPFAMAYIDDIIIFSDTREEHITHLEAVLKRLQEANLCVKLEKCEFLKQEVAFLGHIITTEGIKPAPNKLKEILDLSPPTNVSEVRMATGLFNYYRKFISDYAKLVAPLTALTRKNTPFIWSTKENDAFNKIKAALIAATPLSLPDYDKEFILFTDASQLGIGAVLCQPNDNGKLKIIEYFSKPLDKCQAKYHVNELETYALYAAIQKFGHYIEGRPVTVYTDNTSVRWLLENSTHKSKLYRWTLVLQRYNLKCKHIRGEANNIADFLSRFPKGFGSVNVIHKVRVDPFNDKDMHDFLKTAALPKTMPLAKQQRMKTKAAKFSLDNNDVLHYNGLIVVDPDKRQKLIDDTHLASGHRGICKTAKILLSQYWWPRLFLDVRDNVKNCQQCAMYANKKGAPPVKHIPQHITTDDVWSNVGMDITDIVYKQKDGTLVTEHLLTCMCLLSRYPEANEIKDTDARTCAQTLWKNVFSRFGFPANAISDRGSNFVSAIFKELMMLAGCKHLLTQSYRPQSNGDIEELHDTIKQALAKLLQGKAELWREYLPFVLYALRHTPIVPSDQGMLTPAYVLFGRLSPLIPSSLQSSKTTHPPTANELCKMVNERLQYLQSLINIIHPELAYKRDIRLHNTDDHLKLQDINPLPDGTLVLLLKPNKHNKKAHEKWLPRSMGLYRIHSRLPKGGYTLETIDGTVMEKPVHPQRLRKIGRELAGKLIAESPSDKEDNTDEYDNTEYEIEKVINHRIHKGLLQYKVKWIGYTNPTWNDEQATIPTAPQAVAEYWTAIAGSTPVNTISSVDTLRQQLSPRVCCKPSFELQQWLHTQIGMTLDLDPFANGNNKNPICKAGLESNQELQTYMNTNDVKTLFINPPFYFYSWLWLWLLRSTKGKLFTVHALVPEMWITSLDIVNKYVMSVKKVPYMTHTYVWPTGNPRLTPTWNTYLVYLMIHNI